MTGTASAAIAYSVCLPRRVAGADAFGAGLRALFSARTNEQAHADLFVPFTVRVLPAEPSVGRSSRLRVLWVTLARNFLRRSSRPAAWSSSAIAARRWP